MTKKELIILVSIVAFDLITKLTANYYLPFEEDVNIIGNKVTFYLTYNQGATGGQADSLVEGEGNKNLSIIVACISGLILLTYILGIRKSEIRVIYKILMGILIYIGLVLFMEFTGQYFSEVFISSWTTSVAGKLTGLAIYGSLFYVNRDRWIKLFSLIILSCGAGNLLSHFYIPYRIIDFISIDGTYELLRIGVFNLADLAFYVGAIGLILSLIALIYRKLRADRLQTKKVAGLNE